MALLCRKTKGCYSFPCFFVPFVSLLLVSDFKRGNAAFYTSISLYPYAIHFSPYKMYNQFLYQRCQGAITEDIPAMNRAGRILLGTPQGLRMYLQHHTDSAGTQTKQQVPRKLQEHSKPAQWDICMMTSFAYNYQNTLRQAYPGPRGFLSP